QSTLTTGAQLVQLIEGYTTALLSSDKFDEAITFASTAIAANSGRRETFGPLICARAEQLSQSQAPDQLKKGNDLIDKATKMQISLGEQYVQRLELARKQIDKRLADLAKQNGGPRSASGSAIAPSTRPAGVAGSGD